MGSTFTFMSLSTALAVARTIAKPEDGTEPRPGQVSRIIIGGVLATGLLLAAEPAAPVVVSRFAAVVFLTSVMVHGVVLGEALVRIVNPPPT